MVDKVADSVASARGADMIHPHRQCHPALIVQQKDSARSCSEPAYQRLGEERHGIDEVSAFAQTQPAKTGNVGTALGIKGGLDARLQPIKLWRRFSRGVEPHDKFDERA